jgi:hypothetical protein
MLMSTKKETIAYQRSFLIGPALAYSLYIVVLVLALVRQNTSSTNINFMFLTFWGIVTLGVVIVLGLLGLARNKKIRQQLLIANAAVSVVIIIVSIAMVVVFEKSNTAQYTCQDYVRCLIR